MKFQSTTFLVLGSAISILLQACGGTPRTTESSLSDANKLAALKILQALTPAAEATTTTSVEINWSAGTLPWDRYTLPVISPNGLHAAVQLGKPPSLRSMTGSDNSPIHSTTIELHLLDPLHGRKIAPLHIDRVGLILSRMANDQYVLVESPKGAQGRWIGQIDWATGTVTWLVADEYINAFPTMNAIGDLAWSRRNQSVDRFHLVLKTSTGEQSIDDGKSDWIMPMFLGVDRLRVFRITDGQLSLVELDLLARNPLLTAISIPIIAKDATRNIAWQIATTNPTPPWHDTHAFYHPMQNRMVIWQPNNSIEIVPLAFGSVAAAPVSDGTWLVATDDRIVRQQLGEEDGIHIRNSLAIPVATTSNQWTHLMLIPQGSRLQVLAINLSQ